MQIKVKVKISRNTESIELIDGIYVCSIKAKPIQNQANLRLIEMLSGYFNVAKSQIKIESGLRSKLKIVSVNK